MTPCSESSARSSFPTVRLLVYNIRYATGTGPAFHLPVPGAGYLRSNRKVLRGIAEFIRSESPDVRTRRGGHRLDPHRDGEPGGAHRR